MLQVLKGYRLVRDRHLPPANARPPSNQRPGVHRIYKVGRTVYKPMITSAGLRGPDGTIISCPRTSDRLLWDSRKDIWTSDPPTGCTATPILDHYFATGNRCPSLPPAPAPDLLDISKHILRSSGSAPGVDNRPYEIYHCGVSFVANLIGQGFHCSDIAHLDTDHTIGPSVDLGVWIPKKEGADTPSGQRPLQLPTTLRRLFGSCLMAVVGPVVEPLLSSHQSAIRGGSCGLNISDAVRHLASSPQTPEAIWLDF